MRFDLNQTGLRRIFSAWQVDAIEYLWEIQKPVKSVDVYNYLKKKGVRTVRGMHGTVSRASIIGFLNSLIDEGILTYTENTGKGGYHRLYSLVRGLHTKLGFKQCMYAKFSNALNDFLNEE